MLPATVTWEVVLGLTWMAMRCDFQPPTSVLFVTATSADTPTSIPGAVSLGGPAHQCMVAGMGKPQINACRYKYSLKGERRKKFGENKKEATQVVVVVGWSAQCTGMTGHNEVVRLVFDPSIISYNKLLAIFWESHNPTQGMRQGNDLGTQYRSGIYCSNDTQILVANETKVTYEKALVNSGYGKITTEILNSDLLALIFNVFLNYTIYTIFYLFGIAFFLFGIGGF